jgi:S1-C subfamily serine protease
MPHNLKLILFIYLYACCYKHTTGFSLSHNFCNSNSIGPMEATDRRDSAKGGRRPSHRRPRHTQHHSSTASQNTGTEAINGVENSSLFWPSNRKKKKKTAVRPKALRNVGVRNDVGDEKETCDQEDEDDYVHECDYYDEVFDSIVKIYATHNYEPDTTMPWQKGHSYASYSSGFVIDGRQILTNAHSVEYAGQVLVRRRGSSMKYRAKIETVANECDLAVLTIEDESFWTTQTDYSDSDSNNDDNTNKETAGTAAAENDAIFPLEFGELPELQDEVEVLGYPTGGDSLSVTKGVVSRIEATEYAQCSGSHLLAIQIDAAINGGNSGGPVVDATSGKVVGIAFQSLEQAENIGYVVPVTVVLHFLEDIRRHGRYSGVTCLGIRFAKLENESMRSYLKLPKETKGGVMVRNCFPTCLSKEVLKENDVILSIDGIPVASDGNVPFRRNGRERVSFASYVQTKFANESVKLDLWRNGGPDSVDVPLAISKDLVPSHWDNQAPPYLIVGGLVFSVLSVPYLEDSGCWGEYVSDSLNYLMNKLHEPLEYEDDQVVILINVLAHPKNTGYDGLTDMHLVSCNGAKVRSLRHLQELLKEDEEQGEERNEYLRFDFGSASSTSSGTGGGGTLVVLETSSLEEIDKEIREEHAIQNSFYFPPSPSV